MGPKTLAIGIGGIATALPLKAQPAFAGLFEHMYPQMESVQYFHVPVQITTPIPTEEYLPALNALKSEVAEVRGLLEHHQELLEQILGAVNHNNAEIELEEISDEDARNRILALFKDSVGSLFYDEIAERLKLPLRQTVEICNRLETEGLIGERKK